MKVDNIIMSIVGLFLLGFGWMVLDTGGKKSSKVGTGNLGLSAAIASGQPVLLEFYADWCGPCQQVAPILEELRAEWSGKAKIVRVNVDQDRELAHKYGASSIPAFVVLRNGKETNRAVGGMPKEMIRKLIF